MNFLFFPGGSYVGGMEIVIQSLMGQLNAMGHPTLAIVSGWNDGDYPTRLEASDLSFEEVKLGRFYRSQPLWTLDTMRNLPAAALRLRQVVRAFRSDAAIYPDPQLLLIGSVILPTMPNILYHHNDAASLRLSPTSRVINARLHRIVCVSHFVAAGLRNAGFEPARVAVVHNGITLLPDLPHRPNNQSICLGIVGQVLPRKQHLLLIKALELLRTRRPSLAFRQSSATATGLMGRRSKRWSSNSSCRTSSSGADSLPTAMTSIAASTSPLRRRSTSRSA
jgi:glycosyltransferase involved in cell wall biosynthesis